MLKIRDKSKIDLEQLMIKSKKQIEICQRIACIKTLKLFFCVFLLKDSTIIKGGKIKRTMLLLNYVNY